MLEDKNKYKERTNFNSSNKECKLQRINKKGGQQLEKNLNLQEV